MPDKALSVFESYNMAIAGAYDNYIENSRENDALKGIKEGSDLLNGFIKEQEEKWEDTGLEELDGLTPRAYFSSINTAAEAMNIFRSGAVICDGDLPRSYLKSFRSFGQDAVRELVSLSLNAISQGNMEEDELQISLMAIKVLGTWGEETAVMPLMEIMLKAGEGDELLMETVRSALVEIGGPSISPLLLTLNSNNPVDEPREYLLMALAEAGKKCKADNIYRTLKESFLKMDNKIIGASCLAEYGDGRAIPALRGYMEKNLPGIDKTVLYEVKTAVEKLGGNVNDLLKC